MKNIIQILKKFIKTTSLVFVFFLFQFTIMGITNASNNDFLYLEAGNHSYCFEGGVVQNFRLVSNNKKFDFNEVKDLNVFYQVEFYYKDKAARTMSDFYARPFNIEQDGVKFNITGYKNGINNIFVTGKVFNSKTGKSETFLACLLYKFGKYNDAPIKFDGEKIIRPLTNYAYLKADKNSNFSAGQRIKLRYIKDGLERKDLIKKIELFEPKRNIYKTFKITDGTYSYLHPEDKELSWNGEVRRRKVVFMSKSKKDGLEYKATSSFYLRRELLNSRKMELGYSFAGIVFIIVLGGVLYIKKSRRIL